MHKRSKQSPTIPLALHESRRMNSSLSSQTPELCKANSDSRFVGPESWNQISRTQFDEFMKLFTPSHRQGGPKIRHQKLVSTVGAHTERWPPIKICPQRFTRRDLSPQHFPRAAQPALTLVAVWSISAEISLCKHPSNCAECFWNHYSSQQHPWERSGDQKIPLSLRFPNSCQLRNIKADLENPAMPRGKESWWNFHRDQSWFEYSDSSPKMFSC
jgi:hypothetical protein